MNKFIKLPLFLGLTCLIAGGLLAGVVYLTDGRSEHLLELTWLRDWDHPYNLGDNEFHLALETDDYEASYQKHKEMGCICYENPPMGIYFITDPDEYWIEIVPKR